MRKLPASCLAEMCHRAKRLCVKLTCIPIRTCSPPCPVLFEISTLLNTGLDRETLAICTSLLESGVNPEALAACVKDLRATKAAASSSKSGACARCPIFLEANSPLSAKTAWVL